MKQIGKKVITLIITLLLISLAAFFAFQIIPGDPATSVLGMDATEQQMAAFRKEMGLDRPLLVRYGNWVWNFLRGDLGQSYHYRTAVSGLLADKLPVTLALTVLSFLFILIISIPLGIVMARLADTKIGKMLNVGNQVVMSIPSFFLGVLLILVFGLILKWFTPGEYISYTESVSGFLAYLIAPAMAIAIPKSAMVMKFLRSSVLEQRKSDYVRTAYSKGDTDNRVLFVHVLKNACIPVITILGMMIADTMAGSIVVEQVFNLPGLGRLLVSSIGYRDYPVVQAIIVYIASTVVIVNFAVDIIYRLADPRIRDTSL